MLLAGLLIFAIWHFSHPTGLHALLLSLIASLAGLTMFCLAPYFKRHFPRAYNTNLVILVVWMTLIPIGLLASDDVIGACGGPAQTSEQEKPPF